MQKHLVNTQGVSVMDMRDGDDAYRKWHDRVGYEPPQANPDTLEDSDKNKLWGQGTKPLIAEVFIEKFMDDKGNFPLLSKRENEVLKLYTNGIAVGKIALDLGIRRQSVEKHLSRTTKKFQKLLKVLDF